MVCITGWYLYMTRSRSTSSPSCRQSPQSWAYIGCAGGFSVLLIRYMVGSEIMHELASLCHPLSDWADRSIHDFAVPILTRLYGRRLLFRRWPSTGGGSWLYRTLSLELFG